MDRIRYICRVEYILAEAASRLFFDHHTGEVLQSDLEAWQDAYIAGLCRLQYSEQADTPPRLQTVTLTASLRRGIDTRHPLLYRLTDVSGNRFVVACGMMDYFHPDRNGQFVTGCSTAPLPQSALSADLPASAGGDGRPQLTASLTAERALWRCV